MLSEQNQPFITTSRKEDFERLTARMKNGLGSTKYKPVDFERLQAIVDAKRQESDVIGQKVQKARSAAKATKERSIIRQHRQVWSRECPRLQKAEEKTEDDIHDFLEHIRPESITDTTIFSLQEYELLLERERDSFRRGTVEPVYQLRDDLLFRLSELQQQQLSAPPSNLDQVIEQIHFVKKQQEDITANLHAEYIDLEKEITDLDLEKYFTSTPENLMATENIPTVVLDSDCTYPDLKDSLIQAFQTLSEKYHIRLQRLQEQLQNIDRFCGWSPNEHEQFLFIMSQYTYDIPNYKELCMEMLMRLFPEKTKQEVMKHERVWDLQRFTQEQLKMVTQHWQRDHEELRVRAMVTLQEAKHAHQAELELRRDQQHQQNICWRLKEKLQQWRTQQEAVAKLEAVIEARKQKEEEARLKMEEEKAASIRLQLKEKIEQFYLKQRRRRELLEQRDQERLANLRSVMEEQARRDKQRVQFRADMLQLRKLEREAQEHERQKEEQERESRLQALRNQVEVVAEANPERMMADTEAWRSRLLNAKEPELPRPLYNINTFTDTQIVSDPRVRVEQALREAGMHHTQYAKDVLSVVKPPKPPRRDTQSMLQF